MLLVFAGGLWDGQELTSIDPPPEWISIGATGRYTRINRDTAAPNGEGRRPPTTCGRTRTPRSARPTIDVPADSAAFEAFALCGADHFCVGDAQLLFAAFTHELGGAYDAHLTRRLASPVVPLPVCVGGDSGGVLRVSDTATVTDRPPSG